MSPNLASSTFIRPHLNLGYDDDRPDGVNTLPELIEFAAEHNPDHVFGEQLRASAAAKPCTITYSQLASAVERTSAWLVGIGVTPGRTNQEEKIPPVAILLGSDISIFIYMCALLRIGTPVLMLSARLTPVAIVHLLKKTSPSSFLVSDQVSHLIREITETHKNDGPEDFLFPRLIGALNYEAFLGSTSSVVDYHVPPKYRVSNRNEVGAFILHTSGTTGLPKPIFHSQSYVLSVAACHRLPEQNEPFHYQASTLPLYHVFGLLAPSLSLSIGMPFVLPPATVIPTGKSTLSMLKYSGARYLLSVPSIIEDVLKLPGRAGLEALQELEIVTIGGAAIKESVGNELVRNRINLLNHWGCTEIGPIAPIERVPSGYDWHYLMPRTDLGLRLVPLDEAGDLYNLVGRARGWTEDHVVQDLLQASSHSNKQYKILGRADDLIVLATGEKIRPATMEATIAEHPDIKDALAFGEGQTALGLLIELEASSSWRINDPCSLENLRSSIDPYMKRANSFVDSHGKISREMLVFVFQDNERRFLRTDKGSIIRKATIVLFEDDIKEAYEQADQFTASPLPFPSVNNGAALLISIRGHVRTASNPASENDNKDFFEAGMDSLQAARLRRSILNALKATPGLPIPVTSLDADFVFENSSTLKLCGAVKSIMENAYTTNEDKETRRLAAMKEMVEKYRRELTSYAELAAKVREKRRAHPGERDCRDDLKVVLLTGSTGSLGCFLLVRIASDENVKKVYCLNRASLGTDPHERQISLMKKRGARLEGRHWEKVEILESEPSRVDLGLSEVKYNELTSVTHIVHNAWPVNFNRSLSSFEPHIKALANLFRLAIRAAGTRLMFAKPTRVLFTSSVAVAGRFPLLNPEGPCEVPEILLDAANTAEFGYPEAKWVGEHIGAVLNELYGEKDALVRASSVRIGQLAGPEGSGAWNESEHFPLIVHSCSGLRAIPALSGSLSWIPVNRASNVITEILFSKRFRPVYHMENPSRQSWKGLVTNLASILGIREPFPIIPYEKWLDRVKAAGQKTSAFKVLGFLESDFVRLSSGDVILRTAETKLDSPTLVKSTAIDRSHLEEYVAYWKRIGAMQ